MSDDTRIIEGPWGAASSRRKEPEKTMHACEFERAFVCRFNTLLGEHKLGALSVEWLARFGLASYAEMQERLGVRAAGKNLRTLVTDFEARRPEGACAEGC